MRLVERTAVDEEQRLTRRQLPVNRESMKMENELRAPRDGTVQKKHVAPGDSVDKGAPLITLS